MERVFKQKRAADSFAKRQRSKGMFASVFEEPTDPHGSTRRARAKRRYVVRYDTGRGLMNRSRNPRVRSRVVRKNSTTLKGYKSIKITKLADGRVHILGRK